MSERPPAGWDAQTTDGAGSAIPDDVLAEHLRRRGTHRPLPRALATSIVLRVDETAPERRWRLVLATWRPRIAVAVSGLTLVLLAGLLYIGGTAPRNGGLPTSSPAPGTPSITPPVGTTWDPTVHALTPPEFLRVLATSPAPGTVLIVDDQIVPFLVSCASADHCPSGELRNASGVLIEAPPGGHLPYAIDPTISTTSIMGPLALQVGSGPNLVFLGAVVGNGLRMAFTADDLLRRSASGGLFVVPGWLWATPPAPCPSRPGTLVPMPTSELGLPAPRLGCVPTAWLTDSPSTPPIQGRIGFPVQPDANGLFGGPDSAGAARQGVFLVRDWGGFGEILAGLQPVFIPSDEVIGPTPEPTVEPTARPSPDSAGGLVMSVDELIGRVLDGSLEPDSIAVASIPVQTVSERWAPGAVHSCPQLCPMWHLFAGTGSIDVVVSMQAPAPKSIVGVQSFLVVDRGSVRALGPTATWPTGAPLDGAAVVPIADGLSAVHGFLRIGPPLLCPQGPAPLETGILGEPLSWSQCPGTWILPFEGPDPWAGPPNVSQATDGSGSIAIGDLSVPDGTLHVQDDAQHANLDARGGLWLVRAAVTNACPPWARCAAPTNPDVPRPGITWYELVGPIVPPAPTGPGPKQSTPPSAPPSASRIVLSRDRLLEAIGNHTFAPGTILITDTTFAPVLQPAEVPALGDIVAKVGDIEVHWDSDTNIGPRDSAYSVVRIREDGGLDYVGPATLAPDGDAYASSPVPVAQGLLLVHGWFYRPTFELECPTPFGPGTAFRAFDGGKQDLVCDPAWILPTSTPPVLVEGGTRIADMPSGAFPVQIRNLPRGGPTEGLFLVRRVACLWSGELDVCHVPARPIWELVGPVVVPGS